MKKYFLLATTLFFSTLASAFVPDLGLIVRHQPMILKSNPLSFVVDGTIEMEGERAPYKLTWGGIKDGYTVEFKKLPSAWVSSPVNDLILYRDQTGCMLILNKAAFPCSTLRYWGDFEFNSSSERVVQTISGLGLAPSSDLAFHSVNSKDVDDKKTSKIKPTIKTIQGTFMSVLEYANGSGSFMDFDTTTYAPLMARVPVDGTMWDLVGSPEFFLEKEENRMNLIVSKRIDVKEGDKTLAVVRREPLKRIAKTTLPTLPSGRGSVSDVPYDHFSEKGRNFLKVLFLTH